MSSQQQDVSSDPSVVECSDDETYSKIGSIKVVNGEKEWQPAGKQMAFLYQQLEKNGSIDLRWQCPGRRSPSVHSVSQSLTTDKKTTTPVESSCKTPVTSEFDFDEEFADTNAAKVTSIPNRRKTGNQTSSKKVAKLDKVMNDMKKYQIIDQQSRQE